MRLSATSSLLSGRKDVVVVASVSCIYGIGNPDEFGKNVIKLKIGDKIELKSFLFSLVDILYERSEDEFKRGSFRIQGDTVDIYVAYDDFIYRIIFWGDEIESISKVDPLSSRKISDQDSLIIYPANLFVTNKEIIPFYQFDKAKVVLSVDSDFLSGDQASIHNQKTFSRYG